MRCAPGRFARAPSLFTRRGRFILTWSVALFAAEVVSYTDFMAAGSLSAARDRGTLRLEGKDYVVKDGDIFHVRFNV